MLDPKALAGLAAWSLGTLGPLAASLHWLERRYGEAQPTRSSYDTRLDLACWFLVPQITAVALQLSGIDGWVTADLARIIHRQPILLQAFEALLISDLVGYVSHRAFHGRALYRWHALHHSSLKVDWLSAGRIHPVNDVLSSSLRLAVLGLLGFQLSCFSVALPLVGFHLIWIHAGVPFDYGPLRYVLVSPAYHRLHHEPGVEGNYASIFPFIDLLFKTAVWPKASTPA